HEAVELLTSNKLNRWVVMQQATITSVPIADVADEQRRVPADDPVLAACRAVGTCTGI
ncbi:MAG: 6-phosphofructokinase, partial [Planctomycetes bacterium]|nr:6-phosphofructokinase [Planctomycetota bacterium]